MTLNKLLLTYLLITTGIKGFTYDECEVLQGSQTSRSELFLRLICELKIVNYHRFTAFLSDHVDEVRNDS